jgi:hypothetical protein
VYGGMSLLGLALRRFGGVPLDSFLFAAGVLGALWYVKGSLRWLPTLPYQVARGPAHHGYLGAWLFGALLGVGWLTIVTTPFVWVGVIASVLAGSVSWGATYGVAFGIGRSTLLGWKLVSPSTDPDIHMDSFLYLHDRVARPLGLALGTVIAAVGAFLVFRAGQ